MQVDCVVRYLMDNLDWLDEELGDFDNDYIVIDCPGTYPNSTLTASTT